MARYLRPLQPGNRGRGVRRQRKGRKAAETGDPGREGREPELLRDDAVTLKPDVAGTDTAEDERPTSVQFYTQRGFRPLAHARETRSRRGAVRPSHGSEADPFLRWLLHADLIPRSPFRHE